MLTGKIWDVLTIEVRSATNFGVYPIPNIYRVIITDTDTDTDYTLSLIFQTSDI